MNRLKDKVILFIGATGNVGKPISKRLNEEGASQALGARTKSKLDELRDEHGEDKVISIPTDVTDHKQIARAIERTKDNFGHIDAVVICVGEWEQTGMDDSIEEVLEKSDRHYQIFFRSVLAVAHLSQQFFRKQWKDTGRVGLITHISSHAGIKHHLPGNITYGAMKAASRHMTISIGVDLEGKGVITLDIAPAIVNTPSETRLNTLEMRALAVQPEVIAEAIIKCITHPEEIDHPLLDSTVVL